MKKKTSKKYLQIPVIEGKVLGVDVYRGYAKLSDLAEISKADIYDKKTNPHGTQRDLSPKHARDAYQYIVSNEIAFWSEVFLCLRNKKAIKYTSKTNGYGVIRVDVTQCDSQRISISRVDGNHRLHYADGQTVGFPPIEKEASFCLAYNLNRKQEIKLFRDINDNQKRMNTSHLDNIQTRLLPGDLLIREEPELYIAQKLGKDEESSLYGRIYDGGKRTPECYIPLRSLKSGIKTILTQTKKLVALSNIEAQYKVISSYFEAVKKWQPKAWKEPKKYLLLRGTGLAAICYIGADIIDRVLSEGKFNSRDMYAILKSGRDWDWTSKGDFRGYSGHSGAKQISGKIIAEFEGEAGLSIKQLAKKIIQE